MELPWYSNLNQIPCLVNVAAVNLCHDLCLCEVDNRGGEKILTVDETVSWSPYPLAPATWPRDRHRRAAVSLSQDTP